MKILKGLFDAPESVHLMVASFDLSVDPELRDVQERLLTAFNHNENTIRSNNEFFEIFTRARIACIDPLEAYFNALEPTSYISARNEAASISLIQRHVDSIAQTGEDKHDFRSQLTAHVRQLTEHALSKYTQHQAGCRAPNDALMRWAQEHRIDSRLEPADFGGLRGAAAAADLEAGETAVSVPEHSLIHEGTAAASDIGKALASLGIAGELLLIVYSMIDRHDRESEFAPFWNSLPQSLTTGLSMMDEDLEVLEGTPAMGAIKAAQQHLKRCYDAAVPKLSALTRAFPEDIPAEHVSQEAFLWASQLWYSYAMHVEFPDGSVRQCLVPMACLMNHSPWPHVVRYGQIDPNSRHLKFPLFRRCRSGEHCLLSYGPLPNLKLLLFYGFALPSNPSDTVLLSFQMQDSAQEGLRGQQLLKYSLDLDEHYLRPGPISARLLAALRLTVGDETYLNQVAQERLSPFQEGGAELERAVRSTLLNATWPMLTSYKIAQEKCASSGMACAGAMMIAIANFIGGQIAILEHCIELCKCS